MFNNSLQYVKVGNGDGTETLTVLIPGKVLPPIHSSHPNFQAILDGVSNGDESIADLFDIPKTVVEKFDRLSDRVTTANGRLYLDGEEIANALADQILRFLRNGEPVEKWKSLVNFYENVLANPNEHSKEQLYSWLNTHDITITPKGMIVGYKGVSGSDGNYVSIHSGKAIVNGEVKTGQIPNNIGDVIEMPRGDVQHDPSQGCHTGLHVGTWDYASGFSRGGVLEVHVNPRDVVSVPTDSDWAKMRVCRYQVVDAIAQKYDDTVVVDYGDLDFDYGWGDGEDDDYYDTSNCGFCGNDENCDGSCY